jgi:hypothetical protein
MLDVGRIRDGPRGVCFGGVTPMCLAALFAGGVCDIYGDSYEGHAPTACTVGQGMRPPALRYRHAQTNLTRETSTVELSGGSSPPLSGLS